MTLPRKVCLGPSIHQWPSMLYKQQQRWFVGYFIGKSNENIKLRNVKYVGDIIENAVEFRVPIGPGNVRKP